MSQLANSPLVASIVSGVAVSLIALARAIQRIFSRLDTMDTKLNGIASDIEEIRRDDNIVRWSHIGPHAKFARRRRG